MHGSSLFDDRVRRNDASGRECIAHEATRVHHASGRRCGSVADGGVRAVGPVRGASGILMGFAENSLADSRSPERFQQGIGQSRVGVEDRNMRSNIAGLEAIIS